MDENKNSKKQVGAKLKYLPIRWVKKKLYGKVPDTKRDSKGHCTLWQNTMIKWKER
jgi:hypothetical protein